jgi:predicted flap endonuclease-1-like 5' DNA nuclease
MAKTVAALFANHSEASEAMHDLIDHGMSRSDISLMTRDDAKAEVYTSPDDDSTGFLRGAGIGGAAGGITGLVVGLSALAIPGIGQAIVAGPLVAALLGAGLGAAAGGVTGALMDMGVPEEHARAYGEGVRRGGVLVTVAVTEKKAEGAAAILARHSPVDLSKRTEDGRQRARTAEAGVHARSSTAGAAGEVPSSSATILGSEPPPPHADNADLQRMTGIGSKWAMLLKTAGVETVHELARRNPAHLHEKLMQVNEQEHVVDLLPSLEQVTDWIGQAQGEAM